VRLGAAAHLAELVGVARVQDVHQVAAIVHGDVGPRGEHRLDVPVVGGLVLAFDRERRDAELARQRRGHVILGRQRVRRAQRDGRPGGLQRDHQVGRLGGHVQAAADPQAGQRFVATESLANAAQDGHLPVGPANSAQAGFGQGHVFDVVAGRADVGHQLAPVGAPSASNIVHWRSVS
jgi:hypothetical protein